MGGSLLPVAPVHQDVVVRCSPLMNSGIFLEMASVIEGSVLGLLGANAGVEKSQDRQLVFESVVIPLLVGFQSQSCQTSGNPVWLSSTPFSCGGLLTRQMPRQAALESGA